MKNRWRIAFLITCAISISYFDRQTLAVAITSIQRDLPISNLEYSRLQAVFLLAYAFMYAAGGRIIDTLGTRRGFFLIMIFWSLACASHGLARGLWFLAVCRFALSLLDRVGSYRSTAVVVEIGE